MENLSANILLVAIVCVGAGGLAGALICWLFMRGDNDAPSVAALREEFDSYRDGVNEHFEKTAGLFQDLTEKYRDVYDHLAHGAQSLGRDLDEAPRLEIVPPSRGEQLASPADDASVEPPAGKN